ncbi:MAG: tRNA modification GTPase [Pirellulaceae bacterium]|nr:tRNA modification GTPase [Pirellulaceae bacterium]
MLLSLDETIAAVATSPYEGLRGIVRLSGTKTVKVLGTIFNTQTPIEAATESQTFTGYLDLAETKVPATLYLWPTEKSYTQEPSAEIHMVHSLPLLQHVVTTLTSLGVRLAEPGEFTMRAFLAGRLDLTQAEAVLGIIHADSEKELQTALSQLAGSLIHPLTGLRKRLLETLAHIEAGLDFVEEEVEFISESEVAKTLDLAITEVEALQKQIEQRDEAKKRWQVALIGPPNTGKSSLFNWLADKQALVSNISGTTRDYLSAVVDWKGLSFELIDTAGLDYSHSLSNSHLQKNSELAVETIEESSQTMTRGQVEQVDLLLHCFESSSFLDVSNKIRSTLPEEFKNALTQVPEEEIIIVVTKIDQIPSDQHLSLQLLFEQSGYKKTALTSSKKEVGLETLRELVTSLFLDNSHLESGVVASTMVRCRESLEQAREHLLNSQVILTGGVGEELLAGEIRLGLEKLGKIVGEVYTEEVLDHIFSQFCIGK